MKILAIETSSNACSVALSDGINTWTTFAVVGNQHAKIVLPQIDELLVQANLTLANLDLLALSVGPGSFTGLRIGAGIIQGLSLAHNLPVVNVSSLRALALQASKQYPTKTMLALLDARMAEVYLGLYSCTNQLMGSEMVLAPAAIELVESSNLMLVGTGAKVYEAILRQRFPTAEFALDVLYPRALEICELAALTPAVSGELALPQYIRNNVTDRSQK